MTDVDRARVFCIGLNKTGTSSFHEAMTILGFESLHWGGPETRHRVEAAIAADRPALSEIDPRYDAFSDIEPLYRHFDIVDEQYPGSHFVLTVRPMDEWIDSRKRHVERNVQRKAAGEYTGHFLDVDEAGWRREWTDHVARARQHFGDSPRFLEVDLTAGQGWGALCRFLSVPEPMAPFPWANRDRRRCG